MYMYRPAQNFRYLGQLGLFLPLVLCIVFSCSTTKQIKDGRTAFQQKQYAVAVEFLESEAQQKEGTADYAELAYLLGESYKNLNDSKSSLKWYIEAAKSEYGPEAYWEMAYALKKNERYEDAILSFQRLGRTSTREREIRQEIEKCRIALRWRQAELDQPLILEPLALNSSESDYAPALYKGRNIVFTSDRIDNSDEVYAWTGNSYSDLYISDIDNYRASPFEGGINTPYNEGTARFSQDGLHVVFTRCHSEVGDSYCRIYESYNEGGRWSEPEEVFQMKPRVNYGDPVLIENDSVLLFTSDDPTGIGGHDLYYSLLLEDNSWSQPELMPTYLNTIGQERFPTWNQSTNTLYYSSDFFTGLGGLDIFRTTLKEDGSWSRPENMLEPYNSSEDDYSLVEVPKEYLSQTFKQKIFFTSTRGAFGNDDIYVLYEEHPEDYTPLEDTLTTEIVEVEEEEEPKQYFLRVSVKEKIFAIPDNPNSYIVGAKSVPKASLRISSDQVNEILETDNNGVIILPLDSTFIFDMLAGKSGYLNNQEDIVISEDERLEKPDGFVFERTIEIDRLFADVEIVLDNIYYDLNKAEIREDAKPALNQLVEILKENPALSIELASHTDCRADEDFNLDLSERRAASAVNYILENGSFDSNRLTAKGYGESRLEINCECDDCTEEEHQINRRTTFKIIQ